ncbi:putative leucine-rich repeat-containing protein DDB_G0290503 [Cotesia glomerata]|uniref:putative leucine-rich repeat-containing protein DDB_G0290503 n=1 Tax=Cotesia glomerata TaxID=32391 RepID=UPI001D010B77|nr:putative leucine-rich repeat-containing protein DDB_G0290503 [Cotesia glomerata]
MELNEKLSSLIIEVKSPSFEVCSETCSIIEDEREKCDLTGSYHSNVINLTDAVISDKNKLSDAGSNSSIGKIENYKISDVGVKVSTPNLVNNKSMMKDTSSSLPIIKAENKSYQDHHDYSPIDELNNNNYKSFVSSSTDNPYSQSIEDNVILEKIDSKDNVPHELNNHVKILKVESFNNDCDNKNKILYKIQQLKPKKENLELSNDQNNIHDLLLNLQTLNQQTLTRVSQLEEILIKYEARSRRLEERFGALENFNCKKSSFESKIKNAFNVSSVQNKKDATEETLKEVNNETINYSKHQKIINMNSWTDNEESAVENLTISEDEEMIYQHEESSNVIIGWNKDEENTIENNLLFAEEVFDQVCNTNEKNLLMPGDNLEIMEDNKSIYQFEEWLDSSVSGFDNEINSILESNENISPPSSLENFEDFSEIKSLSNNEKDIKKENIFYPIDLLKNTSHDLTPSYGFLAFIPYFPQSNINNDFKKIQCFKIHLDISSLNAQMTAVDQKSLIDNKINSKMSNTEKIIREERPIAKIKQLFVVLDRNAVPNYLKKKNVKSFVEKKKSKKLQGINKNKSDDKKKNLKLKAELSVYNCAICKSKFTNLKLFNEHAKSHIKTKYACEEFSVNYRRPNLLRPHINKKKCFKCDCYDDKSSQSIALNRNVQKSSNQYFFRCKFCDFATAYSSNLQVHKLKHVHNAC